METVEEMAAASGEVEFEVVEYLYKLKSEMLEAHEAMSAALRAHATVRLRVDLRQHVLTYY